MDLNSQMNSSDHLQMEDKLTMEEIERILDFPISDTGRREPNQEQDSEVSAVSWASDTSNDLYSFIDSYMGSGIAASTQQSDDMCVEDLSKPMIFPMNELKEYSVAI